MNSSINTLESKIDSFINENKENFLKDLSKIIAIKSVRSEAYEEMRFGKGSGEVLNTMLSLAQDYGFHTKNNDYYYGTVSMGNEKDYLGIISHLDVVPEASGWGSDPYTLTLKDGFLIGRGVEDDKGPAMIGFYAMRFLKEHNIPLKHGVKLILGCAEESGMEDIDQFIKCEPAPKFSFTPDSSYPVCNGEKGIFGADLSLEISDAIVEMGGGVAPNVVPDKAFAVLKNHTQQSVLAIVSNIPNYIHLTDTPEGVKIEAFGVSAHASTPWKGTSAIYLLTDFICSHKLIEGKDLTNLLFVNSILMDYKGSALKIDFSDEMSGFTTCIGAIIKKTGNNLILNINVRHAVSQKYEDLLQHLTEACTQHQAQLQVLRNSNPHYISADHEAVVLLTNLSNSILGVDLKPYVMGGGTYARKVPNCVAFGPDLESVQKPFPEGHGNAHQPDECASLDLMLKSIKIFILSLIELDKTV